MASRPVPAEGSSTTIGGRDRGGGARREAERRSASRIAGSAWLSSERRVWVGRRPAILASIGSMAAGDRGLARAWRGRTCAGTGPSPPRRRHRRSSSPRRLRHRSRRRRAPSRRGAWRRRCGGRVRDRGGEDARPRRCRRQGPCRRASRRRRSRVRGRRRGNSRHGRSLGRAGTDRAEGRSLSIPPAQTRSGRPLPLTARAPQRRSCADTLRARPATRPDKAAPPCEMIVAGK